jgi:hypothetical protein
MITYYLKGLLTVVVVVGTYGFAIPTLMSAASTVMVLGGLALLFITPVLVYLLWSDEIAAFFKAAKDIGVEAPVETKGTKKKSSAKA